MAEERTHNHGVTQCKLGQLPLIHLLLDGARRKEAVNNHWARLALAPNARHGLEVHRRVPVDVVKDDARRAHKVEAHTAGARRQQKNKVVKVLRVEAVDDRLTLARRRRTV